MAANISKVCIILAAIGLVVAIIGTYQGDIIGIPPEGFSRASTNLALLAIGLPMIFKNGGDGE